MLQKISKKKQDLKAYFLRRKLNVIGLVVVTLLCTLITILGGIIGFKREKILIIVTIGLYFLCAWLLFKQRRSFKTLRPFKVISRKLRKKGTDKAAHAQVLS